MAGNRFAELYKKLNPEQKQAVDAIEGPVMVIAGPGTGKTQILTLRIANILRKTDMSPDSILALTFTESGVFSMRRRLVEIIGPEGYRVHLHTFHSFGGELIKDYPDAFPKIIGASHVGDVEKVTLIREIIGELPLARLKPFGDPYFYVNPLRSKISELKRENISPATLREKIAGMKKHFESIPDLYHGKGAREGSMKNKYAIEARRIEKNEELLAVYERYEDLLVERHLYDYEDMIVESIRALENDRDLLLSLQEEYQYLLADEHQDANNSQNRLLELLSSYHENPNLFIVGDEKQAIFRFQGASLENFLYFKKRYPNALVISLRKNYRSRQAVLDAAGSLISRNPVPDPALVVPLESNHVAEPLESPIELRCFENEEKELAFLVHDIRGLLDEGVEPSEIAVLYRNNRDADAVRLFFEKAGVPFVVESDQDILADDELRKLILLLRGVQGFGDESKLPPVLSLDFLSLDVYDVFKLLAERSHAHEPLYEILGNRQKLEAAGIRKTKPFTDLYVKLQSWKTLGQNRNLLSFLEILMEESGYMAAILSSPDAEEKLAKVRAFFDEVRALVARHPHYQLDGLILYLDLLAEHHVYLRRGPRSVARNSVRLMTAHRSKGLEFDYVYIIGCYDGHWGSKRSLEHFIIPLSETTAELVDTMQDERRLFYVALTRARLGVKLSYARLSKEGKEQLPSRFVEEIEKPLIREMETKDFEATVRGEFAMRPRPGRTAPAFDPEFIRSVFLRQGLSVTALNNYLRCPWDYFYASLLRIPRAPTKHGMYGTAAHAALKDFFTRLREGEMTKEQLLQFFRSHLNIQPLSREEYDEVLPKGERALAGYYDAYHGKWNTNTISEFRIVTGLPAILGGTEEYIRLRGDLDKVEFLDDGGRVNVVDYKTKKPTTRGEIEGTTKTSTGDYKRQLVFYHLLLDLYDNGKYRMVSGEIDFIEPDDKERYRKERFEISEEEVAELKKEVERVACEIFSLKFMGGRCDKEGCEYCYLRDLMFEGRS